MSASRAAGAARAVLGGDPIVGRRAEREDVGARDSAVAEAADDRFLVARVRRGDMEAYGELVQRYMRRAFSIAYSVLRHREDAEDAVQDAFIRTLERLGQLEDGKPFRPWFYRIVVNRAISFRRARSVRATSPVREELCAAGAPPDRAVEQRELRERLLRAVDELPERQRTILLLADVEELNSGEIAEILEMPSGTVRYHLHLGRRALRNMLATADEGER